MPGEADTQNLLLEHLSSGMRCVIHLPPRATGEGCGHGVGIAAATLLVQIKAERGLQAQGAKQIAERTDLDRQLWVPAAAGESLRQKNVPIKHQFIRATSTGPPPSFHKKNNNRFLYYFPSFQSCTEQAPPPRSKSSHKRSQA